MSQCSDCSFCCCCCLFVCFLFMSVCMYVSLCDFACLVLLLPFGLGFYLFGFFLFFLFFFLPLLLSHLAGRFLMLQPGVRPELPRWESQAQDIAPPETSQPHIISIGESSPRDPHLNAKTQLHPMASKLQCWTPHAKQLARQEHNPTHYQRGCLRSY